MRAARLATWARRARYPFLFAMATLAGLSAVLLLLVLMERERIGSFALDRPPAAARSEPQRRLIAGVVDVHLRRHLSDEQVALRAASWADFARGVGAEVRSLSASDGDGITGLDAVDVLIVPGLVGLDGAERRSLERALRAGKGLLVAAGGDLIADEALTLQSPFWRRLLAEPPRLHVFDRRTRLPVGRDLPFRGGLPRGAGVLFAPGARVLLDEAAASLPIRWGRAGAGRWVHFGFDPAGVPPDDHDRATVSAVLGGAFSWLGRTPVAETLPWPGGRAATLLVTVTSDGRPLPPGLTDLLAGRGVPWTLTHAPGGSGAAALPAAVDLATRGDPARAPRGLPADDQARLLAAARATTRLAFGQNPRGYAPPGERVDEHTLGALARTGFDYLLAGADPRLLQPDIYWSDRLVVRIPRTADDDLGYALRAGQGAPEALRRADLHRVFAAGGLFTLHLDAAALARPGALDDLRTLLDEALAYDPWRTHAADLATWWRRRAQIQTSVEAPHPHRLLLRLSNVGDAPVHELAVRLQLPTPAPRVDVELSHWRRTLGSHHRVVHTPGSDELVIITRLPAGANEVLHLEWP